MKKEIISIVVLFIVLIILGTNLAFADMGAQSFEPYKAYISNLNGANYYSTSKILGKSKKVEEALGTLEYNTEISVIYEYEVNSVTYAQIKINDDTYLVKTDDISIDAPYNKEINQNNKVKIKIVVEEGIEIYEGPAYGYSKTGKIIPFGTELVGYWASSSESNPWIYVSYENTNGYICVLEARVAYEEIKDGYTATKLYTFDKCKIYKNKPVWGQKGDEIGEIPANTVIDEFFTTDLWSEYYYITYNGVSGFISKYDIARNRRTFSRLSIPKDEITLYKIADKSSEVLYKGSLTEEEKNSLVVLYSQYNIKVSGWYYIKCKDKAGWILVSDKNYDDKNAGSVSYNYKAKIINENGAKYYEQNYDTGVYENVGTLECGKEIEVTYEYFDKILYAVIGSGKERYYIKRADLENLNLAIAGIELDEEYLEEIENLEIPEPEISNQENSSKVLQPSITIICVVIAVIIFLMSIVILKIFNRKQNKE